MTARTARWIAWAIVVIYVSLAAVGLTLQGLARTSYAQTTLPVLIILMSIVGVWILTGALIISRNPRHPIGWLLCAAFIIGAMDMFAAGYAAYDSNVFSGSLPGVNLALLWLKLFFLGPHGVVAFTLIILLYPDGKFTSPGWRKVAWTTIGALLLFLPLQAVEPGFTDPSFLPDRTNPLVVSTSLWATLKPLMWTAFSIMALCYGAAFVSLLIRLRNSHGDVRQQIKWLLFPAGLFVIYLLLFIVGIVRANEAIVNAGIGLGQLAIAGMVITVAFVIFKYRLYDVDVLINRALVYGGLTGCVILVYVLTVGAFGLLFQSGGNLLVALVATGLVAVLFQPLRVRLQKGVNRLMYGERDEPFTVLRRLGKRLESSGMPEEILQAIVETVVQALKLPYAEITLRRGEKFERAARYGKRVEGMVSFPIQYQGQIVGHLNAGVRGPRESLTGTDEELLHQIAQQAGPVAQAVQLTRDLRRSRARLITTREEERRRLRRDLHDGLGPVLASQGLKIAAVHHLLDSDPETARKLLNEMAAQNETTVAEIRRLVYALRPPELDELGLTGAVREYTAGLNVSKDNGTRFEVSIQPPGEELKRLPAAIEVAAYRIATEALTNVTRHAHARYCAISFEMGNRTNGRALLLEIADDGIGFEENGKSGIGLNSMHERAEEVGGVLQIESIVNQGTRVSAAFPLAE